MKLTLLRRHSDRLRNTTKVSEKEQVIRDLLRKCEDDEERVIAAMLLVGKLSLPTEGLTTGIKEAFIAKDLGMEGKQSLEDIAKVAMERAEPGKNDYDLGDIWAFFRSYLEDTGRKNADKSRIVNLCLFDLCKEKEDVPFLLQILCGKVNNGVDEKTIVNAILREPDGPSSEEISRAWGLNPNLAFWVKQAYDPDMPFLKITALPGTPMEPQLCARVDDLAKVLEAHGTGTYVQPKLDGQRVHIHIWSPSPGIRRVQIFSREMHDITEDYPEVVSACTQNLVWGERVILDGELVAMEKDGTVAPFSLLQRRLGRKKNRALVDVGVIVYDILLKDDEDVASMPYDQRLILLQRTLVANTRMRMVDSTLVWDVKVLYSMLFEAYERGEEGLVCKDPNSLAAPGMRSKDWIKLKPDYMQEDGFGDSFDLVVIGYSKGRGKRYGTIGALFAAVRDTDKPHLALWPVCKVGTGLTDEDLQWWKSNLEPVRSIPDEIATAIEKPDGMDSWVIPKHVIEVKAAQVTKTDKYAGFSLRHPRLIRRRPDKSPASATGTDEVTIP